MTVTTKKRPQTQMATIIEKKRETLDTHTLTLQLPEGMEWTLGQFVMVRADINGKSVRRAYTISSSPTRQDLQITVRQTDTPTMSKYLNDREVGEELEIKGPYGKFIWTQDMSSKVVCLGAGSGITPSRAFLQYFIDKQLEIPLMLLYSCSYGDNVIYETELPDLISSVKSVDYELSITREPRGLKDIRNGRISKEYLEMKLQDWDGANFYICGAPGFVNHMIDALKELGIEKSRVFREKWG